MPRHPRRPISVRLLAFLRQVVVTPCSTCLVSRPSASAELPRGALAARSALTLGRLILASPILTLVGMGDARIRRFNAILRDGGSSFHTAGSTSRAPRWIKLQRNGSSFIAWESSDGVAWTKVGSSTITMGASIQVMLAMTAHDPTRRFVATFTILTITPSGNG